MTNAFLLSFVICHLSLIIGPSIERLFPVIIRRRKEQIAMSQSKKARLALASVYLGGAVLVTLAALRADDGVRPKTTLPAPQTTSEMGHAAHEMVWAAQNWWASLSPDEQAKARFEFNDDNRFDWHFIPRVRKGLAYKDMNSAQRALAVAFLSSGLSTRGFMQAETIMSLDEILKEMEPGPPKTPYRDPENYSFTIFGTPGEKATWGWRVEGHHLSLNFTIVGGKTVVGGPVFFGSNPAEVREGPRKGLRVLAREDDAGFEMMKLLTEEQKKKVNFEYTDPRNPFVHVPGEIITSNLRKPNPGPPVGLAYADMTAAEKKLISELVEYYANRLRPEMAGMPDMGTMR
ncbi:MAG TPA: DUF3500 domain-containing protein [Tepidisphaeraceae bacterium]|jgi:hypothetical protein|nr:DUF3500 domain-containing protein [Tepidisphaeraceae bacterium]